MEDAQVVVVTLGIAAIAVCAVVYLLRVRTLSQGRDGQLHLRSRVPVAELVGDIDAIHPSDITRAVAEWNLIARSIGVNPEQMRPADRFVVELRMPPELAPFEPDGLWELEELVETRMKENGTTTPPTLETVEELLDYRLYG